MKLSDLNQYQNCIKGEKKLRKRRTVELRKLTKFISACTDPIVRSIMTKRFLEGESWVAVAGKMGGNMTADHCRIMVSRYLSRFE